MPAAPALDTDRLTLRGHRLEDYEECLALWSAPEVVRFISGKPTTREEMWARLMRYAGNWALLGYGFWVVRERATGKFVGEVGICDFHREMEPPLGEAAAREAGWVLSPAVHGRGYATEAVQAALSWADANGPAGPSCCLIHPDNQASIRVAEKVGFQPKGRGIYKGEPSLVFERPARR